MAGSNGALHLGLLLRNGEMPPPDDGRTVGWRELREMATVAEDVGFETLWVADHFLFRRSPPVMMPEGVSRGVLEAWTVLGALAAVTGRVTLGPFVACTSFRNPALLAKMADTLDEVSGGRLILGLGAGWHEPEFDAFGYPFDHLASRFEEALRVIVPLLREGHVDFRGQYYVARECELRPRGPRPSGPPIWIGAGKPRMLRLVARYADAYNTVWHSDPDELGEPFAALEAACRDVGRDPATVRRTSGCFVTLPAPGDRTESPGSALTGTPEEIAARLRAFHAAGAEHMAIILNPWDARAIERFGRVIETLRTLER
jgi:probable F420-dependent oxidoreductase